MLSFQVCNILHHFLLRAFHEQYECRAKETEGEVPLHVCQQRSLSVSVQALCLPFHWSVTVHSAGSMHCCCRE